MKNKIIFADGFSGFSQETLNECCYVATLLIRKHGVGNFLLNAVAFMRSEYKYEYIATLLIVIDRPQLSSKSSINSFDASREGIARIVKEEIDSQGFGTISHTREVLARLSPMAMMCDPKPISSVYWKRNGLNNL